MTAMNNNTDSDRQNRVIFTIILFCISLILVSGWVGVTLKEKDKKIEELQKENQELKLENDVMWFLLEN